MSSVVQQEKLCHALKSTNCQPCETTEFLNNPNSSMKDETIPSFSIAWPVKFDPFVATWDSPMQISTVSGSVADLPDAPTHR